MNPLAVLVLVATGVGCLLAGIVSLRRRAADRRWGGLVAIDAGRPITLRSDRYHLVGRPDALRRRPDGALVPVELKRRSAPSRGPFPSHVVQLGAYCLLIEEETGRAPPFGVLRYADREMVLPWDGRWRAEVLTTLRAAAAPYDGAADPTPAKCARCPWSPSCDVSLAGRT